MSAAALLQRCEAAGVTLRLDPPDTIVVSGPAEGRARHLPEVRANKPALVALLAAHQEAVAEAISERAAIMEVDGGLPQDRAQAVAALASRFYQHHWTCRPCQEGARLWSDYVQAAAAVGGAR